MKKVVYLATTCAMLASMVVVGNAFAARTAKSPIALQICSSGPLSAPSNTVLWEGVQNGFQMALNDWAKKLKSVGVVVSYPKSLHLDDGQATSPGYDTNQETQNAIQCAGGNSANTVAYLGTLNSGATLYSEPVTNKAHMAMISPSNTNPDLTSAKPISGTGGRASQEPLTFKHVLKHVTFYRTVTTDKLQGPAGALYAHDKLHMKSVYIVNDGTLYGSGLATFFESTAKRLHMTVYGPATDDGSQDTAVAGQIKQKNPDMVYCGCNNDITGLPRVLRQGGSSGAPYTKLIMGGDALVNNAWLANNSSGAGPGAVNNSATLTGPDPSKSAPFFKKDYLKYFNSWYHAHGIGPYDGPGYDAAGVVMQSIYNAAKAHKLVKITNQSTQYKDRGVIVAGIAGAKFKGVTGTTTFDGNGDTKNKIISVYHSTGSVGSLTWQFKGELGATGSPT